MKICLNLLFYGGNTVDFLGQYWLLLLLLTFVIFETCSDVHQLLKNSLTKTTFSISL